jgi:mRNA interferase HigB
MINGELLRDFAKTHASSAKAMRSWYSIAKESDWAKLLDVRERYATAESVGDYTIFNIEGNEYRLVTTINYRLGIIYIHWIGTHAEYDKHRWKR